MTEENKKVSRQVRRAQERARLRASFNKTQRRMFFRLPTADKRAIYEVSRMIASGGYTEEQQPDEVVEVENG
jgi:hypothetical protein